MKVANVAAVHPQITTMLPRGLDSGLPAIVELKAELFEEGVAAPIATSDATCHVVFDLWDGEFVVSWTQSSSGRPPGSRTGLKLADVATTCLDLFTMGTVENARRSRRASSHVVVHAHVSR